MGIKRRAFLVGGAAVVGGGLFALRWAENAALRRAARFPLMGPSRFPELGTT